MQTMSVVCNSSRLKWTTNRWLSGVQRNKWNNLLLGMWPWGLWEYWQCSHRSRKQNVSKRQRLFRKYCPEQQLDPPGRSPCPFMLWSITSMCNLCPHAATLLIKGPTQPVLEGESVTLECLYSDSEANISQVHFEKFAEVSHGNKWVGGRERKQVSKTLITYLIIVCRQRCRK